MKRKEKLQFSNSHLLAGFHLEKGADMQAARHSRCCWGAPWQLGHGDPSVHEETPGAPITSNTARSRSSQVKDELESQRPVIKDWESKSSVNINHLIVLHMTEGLMFILGTACYLKNQ